MPERENTCCFTGHREYKLPWGSDENDPRCRKLQQQLFDAVDAVYAAGIRHFICGMANGCDLYFFDAARYLRLQHPEVTIEAAIPFAGQADRWRPELRERYAYDLRQCDYQTLVQEAYTPGCMMRRNRYMVDASRILIAAFDGRPGGTARTLEYPARRRLEIIQIPHRRKDKKTRGTPKSVPRLLFLRLLAGFDLLDGVLVAAEQIGMLTLAVRAYFCVFDRWICLFAVLAVGHGGERLDLQLRALEILRFFHRPLPAVGQVIRDDAADLADLQRDAGDLGQVVFLDDLFDLLDDIEHGSQFVHRVFLRSAYFARLPLMSLMVSLAARLTMCGRMAFILSSVRYIRLASGISRCRWIASNSQRVVHRPQPMHLFWTRRSRGSGTPLP